MKDDAILRDALIELDNLRRRDERMRFESETLLESLELLASRKPGKGTLRGIFDGVCRVTLSERGILVSHGNGKFEVTAKYGDDLDSLRWENLPLFAASNEEEYACFFDLHRVDFWPDNFRAALPDFRSALFGRILTEESGYSILLLRRGLSNFTTTVSDLFKRHLSLLKQGAAQAEAANRQTKMEQELRDAQKLEAVGQLAGGIAHEINTPSQYVGDNLKFLSRAHQDLFSVLEKSKLLMDAARGHESLRTMAEDIDALCDEIELEYLRQEVPLATEQSLAGIGQVSRIVLAMKEFSHPGTKEMSLTDINRALENTITISRNEWKHFAEVATAFDDALPAVPCLPGEMNQVFLNLIVNAGHAIKEKPESDGGGLIHISTETDGSHVIIRVADNGTGMPDEIRDRVFDPFFTTKDVGKGTGQGLAIAWDFVVNKHGGTISIDTEPGRGTTFTVRLPIKVAVAAKTSFPDADPTDDIIGTEL